VPVPPARPTLVTVESAGAVDPATAAAPGAADVNAPVGAEEPSRLVDEFDTPSEVDAAFRTQRRAAVGYFVLFLLGAFAMPALTVTVAWWSESRLIGGMSPGFVMAAGGLYLFFFLVAVAAASLANAIEDAMLGGSSDNDESDDQEEGP
jgi:hypothetical protein